VRWDDDYPIDMTDSVSLHCPNCGAAVGPDAKQCTYCQAALATMSCPNCFNRVFIGSAFCPHCGTRAARQVAADAAPDKCPRCKTVMAAVHVGAMALAECPDCAGVWVDAEAFDRLCADREAQAAVIHRSGLQEPAAATLEKISYRPCPRCHQMMNRVNFAKHSGVILDVCRKHGTFFDRDELHRVVTFIQAGGVDRAREKDRQDLEEAERRLRSLQAGGGAFGGASMMSPYVDGELDLKTRAALTAFELFVNLLLDR
jgi:Zn-finger nucleic acid-binding protein